MNMLATKVVRVTDVRLRYTRAWLLLAIGVSFSAVAHVPVAAFFCIRFPYSLSRPMRSRTEPASG